MPSQLIDRSNAELRRFLQVVENSCLDAINRKQTTINARKLLQYCADTRKTIEEHAVKYQDGYEHLG